MKIVLLDTLTMGSDMNFKCIEKLGELVEYGNTSPDEVAERIKDADVVALNKVVLDEKVLKSAKNLKLICVFAIGYNNIDIEYCKAHGIKVRNVPGYCSGSVCQHTFALLFSLIENMRYYDDFVKDGRYSASGVANHLAKRFFEIEGKKIFTMGGGESSDVDIRRDVNAWSKDEIPTQEELLEGAENLEVAGYDMDVIVTHEPPLKVKSFLNLNDNEMLRVTALNAYFEELSEHCKFKKWFFGSLHLDKYISGTHRAIFKDIINIETGEKL